MVRATVASRRALLALVVAPLTAAGAQAPISYRLNTLQNPPEISWYRLDAPHFTVIYPDSLAGEAQRVATLLEGRFEALSRSLGRSPPRIPVVLNQESLTTNAYVAWSPRRSQWYPMSNTTVDAFGPVDWYQLLAVHEGRHVVQEHVMRTGWVGLAARLFGDNTTVLLAGSLYFPAWLWEGDAVAMETALLGSGRGRQPSFTGRLRAMRADSMAYEYYPAWQGSYRTYLPDWYELGYILTNYVRRHHGDSAWRRVMRRASWNPLVPWALSKALERETGQSLTRLHRAAVAEIDGHWREQRAAVIETPATRLSPANDDYHVWSLPQYAGDGSVIAAYSDLNTVTQLVRLRNGRRETLVRRVGLVGELQFHVRGSRVVWSEYQVDPRYGERNFLEVRLLDLATGKVRRLTHRTRFYGPALSPDGRQIAVVEFDRSRAAHLVILDAESGRAVQRVSNPSFGFLVTPAWSVDGASMLVVDVHRSRGNALLRVSLRGARVDTLIDYRHQAISRPVPHGARVYFGSPRSGLDNVWVLDTATRQLSRVTARRFGATGASVSHDGSRLLFSDQNPAGYDVAEMALDSARFEAEASVPVHAVLYADSVVAQESRLAGSLAEPPGTDESLVGAPRWPTRRFKGWSSIFDFHSLMIAPTADAVNAGLALESRNLLNTFGLTVGAVFNLNEGTAAFEAGASYAGLPTILDAGVRLGSRVSTYTDSAGRETAFSWKERSVQTVVRLPLTRLNGQRRQSVTGSVGWGFTRISAQPVGFRFENNNGVFMPLSYGLTASHARAAAYRDLYQTGASLSAIYRHTPGGQDYRSHIGAARGTAITRGLFANHAVVADAGHEEQRPTNYRFASELQFPRGFPRRYHDRLTRAGLAYHAPLVYPDLALGPLVYVRRVQGSVFVDAARGSDRRNVVVTRYRSMGAELTTDLAPFGTRSTMRVGVRLSQQLTGERRSQTDFIIALPQ
jgi:hypothetical protein